MSAPGDERRWVTPGRLYALFLVSSLYAAVSAVLMILSKLSANDFFYLHEYRSAIPALDRLLRVAPFLDIEHTLPFFSSWSWHDHWDHKVFGAYTPLNVAILVLVVAFRRRITGLLRRPVDWLYTGTPMYPRAIVFGWALILGLSYQTKSHLGFFLPGIDGWHYRDQGPVIRAELADPVSEEDRAVVAANPFLDRALIAQNARYLPTGGYLEGTGMYLHFRGGEILPANDELTDMVFPEYVFGSSWEDFELPDVYFRVTRAALANRRRGRRAFLPIGIAYPNHVPRMPLSYTDYPDAQELERITFWHLWVEVNAERRVHVVKAERLLELDAP